MTATPIVFEDYPYWTAETLDDIKEQLRQITNARKDDITQISNIVNVFVSGRKVGKIPTSSTDVTETDRIGDQNYDASYFYLLVDNGGTAEWRRIALGSW